MAQSTPVGVFVLQPPRLLALLPVCLGLAGCVSADLGTIAPTASYAPGPSLAVEDIDSAAEDFAAAPMRTRPAAAPVGKAELLTAGLVQTPAPPIAAYTALPPRSSGASVDALIAKYAAHYGLREEFVRKVVRRESTFNPRAYNRGHYGLMQIKHQTARGMGYRGPAEGLLDAETNLIYAVRYLRGAWLVAGGDEARADRLYQSGYYYHAKRAGLLEETGLGRDRVRKRRPGA